MERFENLLSVTRNDHVANSWKRIESYALRLKQEQIWNHNTILKTLKTT